MYPYSILTAYSNVNEGGNGVADFKSKGSDEEFVSINKSDISSTPSVFATNMIFLFSVIVLLVLQIFLQYKRIQLDIIGVPTFVMEVLFFLLPPLIYLAIKGVKISKVLRFNSISVRNAFIIIGIMLTCLPFIGVVNYVISLVIETFGRSIPNPLPEVNNWVDLMLGLFIIALTPAVCEEVWARGLIMRGYERFGVKNMIIVSALLFSILHKNIQSFIPIFIMGLVLGYVTYRTNSIFAGIIAHFTNNAFAVFATFGATKFHEYTGVVVEDTEQAILSAPTLIELTFVIPILALAGVALLTLLKELNKNTREKVEMSRQALLAQASSERGGEVTLSQYIPLMLGIIIIGIEFGTQIVYMFAGR